MIELAYKNQQAPSYRREYSALTANDCRVPQINYSNIMLDLLIIVGAELTVLLSIAAMSIYRLRTDVLTGPYIQSATDQSAEADMGVLTGQPQTESPPGLGNGVCSSESIPIHEPPLLEESPGPNSIEIPTTDRISALTTLAASLGLYGRDILLFKDTAGSIGADGRLEPGSQMTSDLNASAWNVASRSSSQGTIRLDPTGHAPMKNPCLTASDIAKIRIAAVKSSRVKTSLRQTLQRLGYIVQDILL